MAVSSASLSVPLRSGARSRPNQLRALVALTRYPLLAMSHNVATMVWGLVFPIVFVVVFGLMTNTTFGGIQLGVLGPDGGPVATALGNLPGVSLVRGDRAALEQQLQRGKLEGLVTLDPSGRVLLEVNPANPQSRLAPLWLRSAVDEINLRAAGVSDPAVSLEVAQVAGRQDRYIDYALPGQIGFGLLSTGIFGTVFGLLYLKKSLVLKRMFATPVRGITILLGQALARLLLAFVQATLILGVGVLAFGFQLPHGILTFLELLLLSGFGLLVFLGFGLLIVGRATSEDSVSPMVNLITLPQFLLSGTFFSADLFPSWVRPVADNLPLSYLNTALRLVANEGADLLTVAPYVLGLAAWGLLAYVLAARTFRWY